MLLPEVTKFSTAASQARYATCARVMNWADDTDSDTVACGNLVDHLVRLNDDLKVPNPSSLGHQAKPEQFAVMAQQALASGSPQNNPRVPTEEEIVAIYQKIW